MVFNYIFLVIYPLLEGWRDYMQFPFLKHSKARHALGFVIRVIVAALLIKSLWLIAYGFYFWLVFNISINFMTGKPWHYLDDSSIINSTINKVINKIFKK